MAAPATHIVIAEKLFEKYFSNKDKGRFMVGTSFPDIRYLGVIDREKTHYEKMGLSDVIMSESFESGVKFHSLVDQVREKYVVEVGMYDFFVESPYKTQAMKLFEDGVLMNKLSNREETSKYFQQIYMEEIEYGIGEQEIKKWHDMLANYFLSTENNGAVSSFIGAIKVPAGALEEIIRVINNIKSVEKVTKIVEGFYNLIDELVREHSL